MPKTLVLEARPRPYPFRLQVLLPYHTFTYLMDQLCLHEYIYSIEEGADEEIQPMLFRSGHMEDIFATVNLR